MSNVTEEQHKAAEWLLHHAKGRHEDQLRNRIGKLLDSLGVEYEFSYRSPGSSGPADIYLPRRRTIIETKAHGLVAEPNKPQVRENTETPKQQLDRYIHAEIHYELISLPLENTSDRPWTGILTDGRVWHVWQYSHQENTVCTRIKNNFQPPSPESLINLLRQVVVEANVVGKPWIPLNPRDLFGPQLESLRTVHAGLPAPAKRRTRTKRRLWREMLRASSMEPDSKPARQRLFVAHSFLVALARGVIHTLTHPRQNPVAKEILDDGFVAWIVDSDRGRQWADDFFGQVHSYEWRRRPGDVLRPLYEQFVDERDRKAFGEFYTPDWLAELIVRDVCDDGWCQTVIKKALIAHRTNTEVKGIGFLDPTCGSGTFLYQAMQRLLSSPALRGVTNQVKAKVVSSLVHGIDVHPVAAEISRATVLRALPEKPPHGDADLRIYEGDALLLHGDHEDSLFRPVNGEIRVVTPKGGEILLPRELVERPEFMDDLRRIINAAATRNDMPEDILAGESETTEESIRECYRKFKEIIQDEGNSVWSWYIRNITGPYLLSHRKVDRIAANPPWVKMANIQVETRKRALEAFADREGIKLWSGGKQAPHFDIAQLFIKQTRELYLADRDNNPAAWLVKKSALKAGSWAKFREWHKEILKQTLDLESLQPFGGGDARRCCVLYEAKPSGLASNPAGATMITATVTGSKPTAQQSLDKLLTRVEFNIAPKKIPRGRSGYLGSSNKPLFRQGATITPKILTVISEIKESDNTGEFHVTTTRSQHKPWNRIDIRQGDVPRHWLHPLLVSGNVLPFSTSSTNPLHALIPTGDNGDLDRFGSDSCEFWASLERTYQDYRSDGRHTPQTLLRRIDYGSNLSAQLGYSGSRKTLIVYPSSGDIMRACRLRPGEAIIDTTLYYLITASAPEAAYLVTLLNAPCLNQAFVQSRESGRHFHQHPWRKVPIPRYDKNDSDHVAIAKVGIKAEKFVSSWLSGNEAGSLSLGQVGMSARIRELLREKGLFAEIDQVARKILPHQAIIANQN